MKFLKYHISIIVPLFLLLFAVESFMLLKSVIDDYERRLNGEYSIVIVSNVPIDQAILKKEISGISSVKLIDTDMILKKFKNSISKDNISKLKNSLPLFYSLKLKSLPDKKELLDIKRRLSGMTGVKRVVTFRKTYDKFYNFLVFNKTLFLFFTAFVSIVVLLLIVKQAEIWIFEHKQRFEIMSILGAPFWMKSAMLYRVVIVDSIISSLAVCSIFYFFTRDDKYVSYLNGIGMRVHQFDIFKEGLTLLGLGVAVSVISVSFAIVKLKENEY